MENVQKYIKIDEFYDEGGKVFVERLHIDGEPIANDDTVLDALTLRRPGGSPWKITEDEYLVILLDRELAKSQKEFRYEPAGVYENPAFGPRRR